MAQRQGDLIHRPLTGADHEIMWETVYHAAHVEEDPGASRASIGTNPDLVGHVVDWGRAGDLGIVAEQAGTVVGAAWLRLLVGKEKKLSYFVDDVTPELVIAVFPGNEGRGIGTAMLTELLSRAAGLYPRIMLTVRASSPAVRLYERLGFRELRRSTNRVGSVSIEMLLDLDAAPTSETH